MTGKKKVDVGRLPVYNELRRLYKQFIDSTRKVPINTKRGAIAEVELAIIQAMDSVSFASDSASRDERLALIRDAMRTVRFVKVRVRTLRDIGLLTVKGYSAVMLHEESATRQLAGWSKKTEGEDV